MRSGLIRVRLIGEMENCEVRKWGDDGDFSFPHFCLDGVVEK